MAKALQNTPCPKCRERGQDRSGDNLVVYRDDGAHCFSCGYHRNPPMSLETFIKKEPINDKEKTVLPRDFQREIPAGGWKWLLQYGLSYSYWKAYCGYSPKENRLVITHGQPIRFSIGRLLTKDAGNAVDSRKWKLYGDGHSWVETIGEQLSGKIVLVEDIISAHKVGQIAPSLCLFGTDVHKAAIRELIRLDRPVVVWLDHDQYALLPKKLGRLQAFLNHQVTYISTVLDPKLHSLTDIKGILNDK